MGNAPRKILTEEEKAFRMARYRLELIRDVMIATLSNSNYCGESPEELEVVIDHAEIVADKFIDRYCDLGES